MSAALLARRASLAPAAPRVAAGPARIVRLAPVAAKKGEVLHIEVRSSLMDGFVPSGSSDCFELRRKRTRRGRNLRHFRRQTKRTPPPTCLFLTLAFSRINTHSYRKQVQVGDEEAPEMAVKRFRRSAGNANVVMEVRDEWRRRFSFSSEKARRRPPDPLPLSLDLQKKNSPSSSLLTHLAQNQPHPQAKRRRQFENSQDKAKRKDKEVRMRRSKKYQYQATTAEDSAASGGGPGALQPAPFAEFFSPAADAFVGSLTGSRE